MREEIAGVFSRKKKVRTVVGGERVACSVTPDPSYRLEREKKKKKCEDNGRDEQKHDKKKVREGTCRSCVVYTLCDSVRCTAAVVRTRKTKQKAASLNPKQRVDDLWCLFHTFFRWKKLEGLFTGQSCMARPVGRVTTFPNLTGRLGTPWPDAIPQQVVWLVKSCAFLRSQRPTSSYPKGLTLLVATTTRGVLACAECVALGAHTLCQRAEKKKKTAEQQWPVDHAACKDEYRPQKLSDSQVADVCTSNSFIKTCTSTRNVKSDRCCNRPFVS